MRCTSTDQICTCSSIVILYIRVGTYKLTSSLIVSTRHLGKLLRPAIRTVLTHYGYLYILYLITSTLLSCFNFFIRVILVKIWKHTQWLYVHIFIKIIPNTSMTQRCVRTTYSHIQSIILRTRMYEYMHFSNEGEAMGVLQHHDAVR